MEGESLYRNQANLVCAPTKYDDFFILLAANCGDPFDQLSLDDSESVLVQGYSNLGPVLEGIKVNFTCISEMELIGPNLMTCMGNGEWDPNPREVTCRSKGSAVITYHLYHHVFS